MRKKTLFILLSIFIVVFAVSCNGSGPQDTVEKMRDAACNADVEEFFSHIDKEYIENKYIDELYGDSDSELAKEYGFLANILMKLIIKYGKYFGYDFGESILDWAWEYIEKDVAKGEDSNYCKLKIIGPGKKFNSVIVSEHGDKQSEWTFKHSWGKYKLISFGDPETDSEETAESKDYSDFDFKERINKAAEKKQETSTQEQEDSDNYDFRKTRWGMSVIQVRDLEQSSRLKEGEVQNKYYLINYDCDYDNLNAHCIYRFNEGTLSVAAYFFEDEYTDPNGYITDYEEIKKKLINKYGIPDEELMEWSDNTYKNDISNHGKALSSGHVIYTTYWLIARSDILLTLQKKDSDIELTLAFTDRDFLSERTK